MNIKTKGYIIGIIGSAAYGTNPLFTLPLYAQGMNWNSVLLFRYVFAILILGILNIAEHGSFRVGRKNLLQLVAMGALVGISSLTLFVSYNYMAAGIASTILFVYPIMVAVIMALCFRERMGLTTFVCLMLATAGICMLYKGDGGSGLSMTGTILALLSALTYAVYIVCVNQTTLRNLPSLMVTFYVILFGALIFAGGAAAGIELTLPSADANWMWLCLLGLAIVPTAVSFLCITRSIHCIGPTPAAILGALEPVTALVIGILVFNEMLTGRDMAGILMILTAVTTVVGAPMLRKRQ